MYPTIIVFLAGTLVAIVPLNLLFSWSASRLGRRQRRAVPHRRGAANAFMDRLRTEAIKRADAALLRLGSSIEAAPDLRDHARWQTESADVIASLDDMSKLIDELFTGSSRTEFERLLQAIRAGDPAPELIADCRLHLRKMLAESRAAAEPSTSAAGRAAAWNWATAPHRAGARGW